MSGYKRHHQQQRGPPPRWLRCPRKSLDYVGQKFIVFKTPLSNEYDDQVPVEYQFHPQMIIDYVKTTKLKLGLWIDLTNTDRFYPSEQIKAAGIRYVKVNCKGHGEAPSAEQVKLFNQICEPFTEQFPDDIIGVHCTHGFNRSGYLICAFLTSVMDWDVHASLLHFRQLRPPGIYKQEYINQLCKIYGNLAEDDPPRPPPSAPELPEWCFEDKDVEDDDGFANNTQQHHHHNGNGNNNNNGHSRLGNPHPSSSSQNGSSSSSSSGQPHMKRRRENFKENPTFMEGVSGVYPITDRGKVSVVQRKVQDMCEWRGTGFPGSQPVSMDLENITLLARKPYMVSWKADGTRYLMLIDGPGEIYFIDRDNCVFHAPDVSFRWRKCLEEHLFNTLVDGEMVLDTVNDEIIPRYLIYDIIKFRGEDVGKTDFRIRLTCIQNELIGPRTAAIEKGIIDRTREPFGVRFKTFWFIEDTEKLLTGKFTKELNHEPDGVIFQPTKDPYKPGRCDETLKWKPPHLNSIDFRLKIVQQSGEGLLPIRIGELYVGGLETPFGLMKATKAISSLNGKIVECKFDKSAQPGGWVFLRERTDKSFPNAFSTARAVAQSIAHPVTQEILLSFIENRRYVKPNT